MSLILISMALGLAPASRGNLMGIVMSAWIIAGVIATSLLFGVGALVNVLPSIGFVVLGFNAGVALGLGLNYAAALHPSRIRS
jgi:hypothetical protein